MIVTCAAQIIRKQELKIFSQIKFSQLNIFSKARYVMLCEHAILNLLK